MLALVPFGPDARGTLTLGAEGRMMGQTISQNKVAERLGEGGWVSFVIIP